MFLGILSEEKLKKNEVRIEVLYSCDKEFTDYSDIYNNIMHFINSQKFNTMEEAVIKLHDSIKNDFSIKDVRVSIEKIHPLQMEYCKGVKIIYGTFE